MVIRPPGNLNALPTPTTTRTCDSIGDMACARGAALEALAWAGAPMCAGTLTALQATLLCCNCCILDGANAMATNILCEKFV